jgi:mannose-6-phosphate isomerase
MTAVLLERRLVPKVWGRRDVPEQFGPPPAGDEPLGEVWYVDPAGDEAELLIKFLFTSEKLSIQVHPDDAAAAKAGHRRGKDEAWVVLEAEPDAVIGLGLIEPVSREALRAAALDSSLEQLVDWRHVGAGDVFYSPAGTIHALGAGLTLVEIQQNLDLTYRLYDYGRPRELHLDEAVAAADPSPYRWSFQAQRLGEGRELLAAGAFLLERWRGREQVIGEDGDAPVWLVPLAGGGAVDDDPLEPGTAWVSRGPSRVTAPPNGDLLVAYGGLRIRFAATDGARA